MFLKACLTKKYAYRNNLTSTPLLHCYFHSHILPVCSQSSLNTFVTGVPGQSEKTVRCKRKSLLSSYNRPLLCSSKQSICTKSIISSSHKVDTSPLSHSKKNLYKIKPNYSSESVRWYCDKKVENSLTEDINLIDSYSEESWNAPSSYEPGQGLPQTSHPVEDYLKAETNLTYTNQKERNSYPNHSSSVEFNEGNFPSRATNAESIKALKHQISNARNTSRVLEIYEDHKEELTFLHYDTIIRKLTSVMDRSYTKKRELHPGMRQLFNQITQDCSRYDPPLLITLLKFLSTVKIPTDAPILQTALQVLRKQFNNLDIKQLLYVEMILSRMRQDAVANSLKMLIPLMLEYRYRNEPLPADLSSFHLIQGLSMFVKNDTADSVALAEKFMMTLYEREEGLEDLTPNSAVVLIGGLMRIFLRWKQDHGRPAQEFLEEEDLEEAGEGENSELAAAQQLQLAREVLFKEVLQYIEQNIMKLSHLEVEKVLSWLSYSYRKRDACAYNQPLLRAYTRRALDQDWTLRSLAGGIMWMLKMNEVDESLLQALLQKIHSTSQKDLLNTEIFVMPLVHALAASSTLASRSEKERHALLARLLEHPSAQLQQETGPPLPFTRLGFDLACLGYFEPDVHRNIINFSTADIDKSGSIPFQKRIKQHFLTLWQGQQLLNTTHERVQVDDGLLAASMESVLNEHHSNPAKRASRANVREVLQQALSSYGPNSVVTAVHTRHGVCVDHVIVVRGESEVVPQPATGEGRVCLDDLLVPDNARVLGVQQIGPNLLLNNYTKLRPQMRLHLQLLTAEGFTVVPFIMPQYSWHYRTDEEKMRYVTAALGQHRLYL